MFKNIKTGLCVLAFSLFALVSSVHAESWPNFHNGNTLIKGKMQITDALEVDGAITGNGAFSVSGAVTVDGTLDFGTDTLTTDAADPGTAIATLTVVTTYLISDETGTSQDVVTVPDGTLEGQVKEFILLTDAETAGIVVAPTNVTQTGGAGTSTLLEDAGDSVSYKWNSALGWTQISNIGGTNQ